MVASALIWSFRFDFLGEEDKDSLCPSGILLFKVLKVFLEGSGICLILPCRPFWKFAALRFVIPEIPTLNRPFLVFLIMLQTLLIVLHMFCELLSLQQLNIYKRSDILYLFGVNLIISDQPHPKASSTHKNCSSPAQILNLFPFHRVTSFGARQLIFWLIWGNDWIFSECSKSKLCQWWKFGHVLCEGNFLLWSSRSLYAEWNRPLSVLFMKNQSFLSSIKHFSHARGCWALS